MQIFPVAGKEKDKFVSDLYLTYLDLREDGKFKTVQLTNKDENDHSAIFSRDSKKVYFLSSRDKGKKLWVLDLLGGEAKEVHEFANGISNLKWLNDSTLLFTSNEGKTLYEQKLEEEKDNVVVVEDSVHWKANRIYSFHLDSKSIERITENKKPISSYTVSKDGKWLVYRMTMSRHYAADANPDPQYFLKDLESEEEEQILEDRDFPSGSFSFSADNLGFYFLSDTASDPEWNGAGLTELYYYNIQEKNYQKINLEWPYGVGDGIDVAGNDVYVALANRATFRLAHFDKSGNWSKAEVVLNDKKDHVSILAISEDGNKIIYEYSTASSLPQYFVAKVAGVNLTQEEEIITLNKKLKEKQITRSEVIAWKGYQGGEVTGMLYYPENYEPDRRYPLIISIHGGPSGVDTDTWRERWSTYPNILTQRGAFVLKPNYHGSSNHGLAFVETIKGNYYEPEMADITNGIELLYEEGKIDKTQMGVMGWSNGAIIATMMTVRYPDMFKVACPGAGDVNWTSDFGTCRFGVSFDQSYFGGAPWDDSEGKTYNENYILKSPLFELEKVKTPTIIFHGSEDRAVPRDQGWEYYRALQQAGQTPVRFLWFPGQPHGLGKITHQMRKMEEELKWIDQYLFNKLDDKNEAFKKDSPLALLLKRDSLQKEGENYGYLVNTVLVPETKPMKSDSTEISVFEVTNAQFYAFNSAHDYAISEGNFPAIVSPSQASQYVQWLSGLTGKRYRLPTEAEAKEMHKVGHKQAEKENTLNHWAGYKLTMDEVPLLREKLNASRLTKSVGSHPAITFKGVEVYDLGGNVAEYDQSGKIYGYSAYDFVDPHDSERTNSTHVGFRVIMQK